MKSKVKRNIKEGNIKKCKVKLRDCGSMTWQDPGRCANCYQDIASSSNSKRLKDELQIDHGCSSSLPRISIMEALDIVFDINRKSYQTSILLDENKYLLCPNCVRIFIHLFSRFSEFVEASSSPSYLFSLIRNRRDYSKLFPVVEIKEEVDICLETAPPESDGEFWNAGGIVDEEGYAENDAAQDGQCRKVTKVKRELKRIPPDHPEILKEGSKKRSSPRRNISRVDNSLLEGAASKDKEFDLQSTKKIKLEDSSLRESSGSSVYNPHEDLDDFVLKPKEEDDFEYDSPMKKHSSQTVGQEERAVDCSPSNLRGRIHVCTECNIGFTRSNHLERHLKQHSSKAFVCDCGVGFAENYHLQYHQKHNNCKLTPGAQVLSQSEISTAVERTLKNAKKRRVTKLVKKATRNNAHHRRPGKFVCGHYKCGKVFTRRYRLKRHRIIHDTKPFPCEFCHDCFRDEVTLSCHVSSTCRVNNKAGIFVEQFPCADDNDSCSSRNKHNADDDKKEMTNSNSIVSVTDTVVKTTPSRERRYACHCGETFSRTNHLRSHAGVHRVKNVICPICLAGFTNQIRLEKHSKIHEPSMVPDDLQNFRSFINGEGQIIKTAVKLKLKRKHLSTDMVSCNVCGGQILQRNLKNHMLSHQQEREAVCELCGLAFKSILNLRSHQKHTHSTERLFLCNICGKAFKRNQHLLDHQIVTHSDSREFKCEECNKSFKSKRNLRQHLHLHEGIKFNCEKCGAAFTRKDNLKVHKGKVCSGTPPEILKNKSPKSASSIIMAEESSSQFSGTLSQNIQSRRESESDVSGHDPTMIHENFSVSSLATTVYSSLTNDKLEFTPIVSPDFCDPMETTTSTSECSTTNSMDNGRKGSAEFSPESSTLTESSIFGI
ncbi:unnamed protein product [Allacma fusca]|uniref:C2H2-type domain-containing protein n=1 Tax=Allacma fusca TaxID=39272 RepID=A0A8J2NUG4_9HEXA|nr:unnamed protein product [Allacma fusca]